MELKDRMHSVAGKVETLRQRYLALLSERREMERQIERQKLEIEKLEKEVSQLKIDNEFLHVARSIPANPEAVARYKGQISKMVRDIDRCIKQLNA